MLEIYSLLNVNLIQKSWQYMPSSRFEWEDRRFSMEMILSAWYDQGYFSSHTIQLLECLLEIHHHKLQKNLSQSGAWKTLQVSFQSQSWHPFLMRGALKMKMMQLSSLRCCYQNLMWFLTQATDELEPDRCLLQLLDSGFGILLKRVLGYWYSGNIKIITLPTK